MSGVRQNFAFLTLGEVANKALRFASTVTLARALAVDEFGVVNVVIALSGFAVLASSLGLHDVGARDIAVARERAGWLAGRVIAARVVALCSISLAACLLVLAVTSADADLLLLGCLLALAMTLSADWIARGLEKMWVFGLASGLGGATVLLAAIFVAHIEPTSSAALGAFVLGEVVFGGVCWLGVARAARPQFGFSGLRPLLRRSWPVAFSVLIVYAYYNNLDTLILAATRSTEEAGIYSAAYRVFLTFNVVPIFAAYAAQPMLARGAVAQDDTLETARLERILVGLACFSIGVVAAAELGGGRLLGTLFGSEFESAERPFILLCVALAWYAVGFPTGYSLIAQDRNRAYLVGAVSAGVVNVGLGLALIPPFGMVGAAVATLAAFATATLVWVHQRRLFTLPIVATLTLITIASVSASVAVAFTKAAPSMSLITVVAGLAAGAIFAFYRPFRIR